MAARKKSTSDVVAEAQEAVDGLAKAGIVANEGAEARAMQSAAGIAELHEPRNFAGFFSADPPEAPKAVEASLAEHIVPGIQADLVQPTITKLQLHSRAHILGIQGTSDSLVVGDVIESIEPDMLGPIAGFVVRLKRGAPVFMPQASVLAVTVVS